MFFCFFGFLENFATCGQKIKKLEQNKEKHKPITFIPHEVVILFYFIFLFFVFSRFLLLFRGDIDFNRFKKTNHRGDIDFI